MGHTVQRYIRGCHVGWWSEIRWSDSILVPSGGHVLLLRYNDVSALEEWNSHLSKLKAS